VQDELSGTGHDRSSLHATIPCPALSVTAEVVSQYGAILQLKAYEARYPDRGFASIFRRGPPVLLFLDAVHPACIVLFLRANRPRHHPKESPSSFQSRPDGASHPREHTVELTDTEFVSSAFEMHHPFGAILSGWLLYWSQLELRKCGEARRRVIADKLLSGLNGVHCIQGIHSSATFTGWLLCRSRC